MKKITSKNKPIHIFTIKKQIPLIILIFILLLIFTRSEKSHPQTDIEKRKEFLNKLIPLLTLENDEKGADPRIDIEYQNWKEWLEKTGELPPDFDAMPSNAELPDPLVISENGKEIPITTKEQWNEKREYIKEQLQHWIYGKMPPSPGNVRGNILKMERDGKTTIQDIELEFGPNYEAKLSIQLIIPDGKEKFPVFMTQWTHKQWAMIAVRHGYIGCIYAGADDKDDTFYYRKIYPEYDFLVLARRAWSASRCIDYLYTLPIVDKEKIALTGHSRNGKQSMIAAAFDSRIKAVIASSPGSGGETPARYDRDNFYAGDMALHARQRRSWFHPRWRFFVGRENKLPVDSNSLIALVAPNAFMISTAINELEANNWAQEMVYRSAKNVYKFLNVENKIAIRYRGGGHPTSARDIEDYVDFFDYVFGRGDFKPDEILYHNYSFEGWKKLSGEKININDYPDKGIDNLLISEKGKKIETIEDWEKKRPEIKKRVLWSLGETPPGVTNPGPGKLSIIQRASPDYIGDIIGRVQPTEKMGRVSISGYNSFGDYIYGDLYYPKEPNEMRPKEKLPVIIWLHPYSYNSGYGTGSRQRIPAREITNLGYAMFGFDQIGFGTRVFEGKNFYKRYPNWSLMGKMVNDVIAAVEALSNLDIIDKDRIYCLGYSLGGTVGIYTASLDDRIKGVVSVCGFSPFRLSNPEKEKSNAIIKKYSHHHGLMPRLGFFVNTPSKMPFDFHEMLGLIAPRPLMIVAPELDWDNVQTDVIQTVNEAEKVYKLLNSKDNLNLFANYDINRWTSSPNPPTPQKEVFEWIQKMFK